MMSVWGMRPRRANPEAASSANSDRNGVTTFARESDITITRGRTLALRFALVSRPQSRYAVGYSRSTTRKVLLVPSDRPCDHVHRVLWFAQPMSFAGVAHHHRLDTGVLQSHVE